MAVAWRRSVNQQRKKLRNHGQGSAQAGARSCPLPRSDEDVRLSEERIIPQARGRDGSHCARAVDGSVNIVGRPVVGGRIRRCQGMQDRPPLDGTATRAAGPACSLALPEVGVRGMFRPYTHFLGRRVVTAEGCSACSRRVWRGHFPRVACRRGQGLVAVFVRPDARRRHEACLPRPVTRPCRRVKRTVARRFLRYQADISGCSAFATPALACGRLADLSSAN